MHYYKRNIGDYHKKAGRLSVLQHGAYTLLIDSCYDREVFPTKEQAIDWVWASSKDEIEAVEFVLTKFFTVEGDLYVQSRIQEDLEKYHETAKTNKRIAIEREAKRREKRTKRAQDVNEAPPNHKPITNNHKPITIVKKKKKPAFAKPTPDEINKFAFDNKLNLEGFFDYYESNGWKVGKNPMKKWEAAARNWSKRQSTYSKPNEVDFDDTNTDWAVDAMNGNSGIMGFD